MKKAKKAAKKKAAPARAKSKPAQKKSAAAKNSTGVAPLGDRVLVKPFTEEEMHKTTSFGIIIPDTVSKEKSDRGTVVAVGAGKKNDKGEHVALEVRVGDKVLYTKPWNEPVKIGDVEYFLINESDILAILN